MVVRMNNYKKVNIILYKILIFVFVLSIILESNSIYSQIYGCHLIIRASLVLITILSGLVILFFEKKGSEKFKLKVDKKTIIFIIYSMIVGLLLFSNANGKAGHGIAIMIFFGILPFFCVFFSNISDKTYKEILKSFVNIVIVLCIMSLFFWTLSSELHVINKTSTIRVIWAIPYSDINSYYFLHFDTQKIYWLGGAPIVRNTGIFTEGPMYAFVLVVALLFNNTLLDRNKYEKGLNNTFIILLTLLTTFSVTGLVCAFIILTMNAIKKIKQFNKKKRAIFIICFIVMILLSLPFGLKIITKKMDTSSASHRKADISNGLVVFIDKPILGYGLNHDKSNEKHPDIAYGYSNTIIPVITDGGFLLGLIYVIPAICILVFAIKQRKIEYICFFIIYLIIIFTTLVPYRTILMSLLGIMLGIPHNKNIEKKE